MKLKIIDNIWGEKVEIGYEGSFFTKDVIVIILITALVIVETPIILLFLKKIASYEPCFYDIIRLIFLSITFPAIFIFAFMVKNSVSYVSLAVTLMVHLFIVYMIRSLISPMETTIDKSRGIVKVKKLFLSYSFRLSQIYQIDLSDQLSRKTGTLIFHIYARLRNGKAYQFFYTGFSDKDDKKYKVFENIMLLLKIINSKIDIEIQDKTKHI